MSVGLSLPRPLTKEEADSLRWPPLNLRAHVKILVTDPGGSVVREVEGDVTDGFTSDFVNWLWGALTYPLWQSQGGVAVHDVAGNVLMLWSPGAYASPFLSLCVTGCPYTSNAPYKLTMPGIWLYSSPFSPNPYVWGNYGNLITPITYYSPTPSPPIGTYPTVTYGGTASMSIAQQMTNTSGSTLTVSSFALVAAAYFITGGALNQTPAYIGILYFDLAALGQSPITWSPAAGMTVTVTIQAAT